MGNLSIQNQQFQAHNILKLNPDKELSALDAAKDNRADEIFFRSDNDTYAASGEGWKLDKLQVGTQFKYQGKDATVLFVNDEKNSLKDLASVPKMLGGVAAFAGVTGTGYAVGHLIVEREGLAAAAKAGGGYALAGLAIGTLIAGGVLAYSIARSPNHESLKAYAAQP